VMLPDAEKPTPFDPAVPLQLLLVSLVLTEHGVAPLPLSLALPVRVISVPACQMRRGGEGSQDEQGSERVARESQHVTSKTRKSP